MKTDQEVLLEAKMSLNIQEAKVVLLIREFPYQVITINIEASKVVNKKQTKSIKD